MRALYNRTARAYNKLVTKDKSGLEYERYPLIAKRYPGQSQKEPGLGGAVAQIPVKHSKDDCDDSSLSSGTAKLPMEPGAARSARELLTTAVDKLVKCTEVLTAIVDRLDLL